MKLIVRSVGDEGWYINRGQLDFTVEVYDKCMHDTLILTDGVIDLPEKVKYSVYNSPLVLETDPNLVTSQQNLINECPQIIIDVINDDESGLDSMFRYDAFANQLIVQSQDPFKTGVYQLQVVAQYEGV